MKHAWRAERPIRVGISSCLLGEPVRFDGGHKRDAFLTESFGRFVEWVPVCPEVECGLGTPRESMRLVRVGDVIRLLTVKTGADRTDQLRCYADDRVAQLATQDLCGFVVKKDSPSCGMERVKVYGRGTAPTRSGRGLFAATLADRCPDLPIEEEGRLSDPGLRENFIERVFAYARLQTLFGRRWNQDALVRFHTAHKLTLMAHSPGAYLQLGRLVAHGASLPQHDLKCEYSKLFMAALSIVPTRTRHANALQHMVGYFKERLDRQSKAELLGTIDDYVRELVPLVVPITLVRHHVRVHDVAYLAGQVYLEPSPKELRHPNAGGPNTLNGTPARYRAILRAAAPPRP